MGWGGGRGTIVSYKIEKENIILSTMCACLLKGWDMFMYRRPEYPEKTPDFDKLYHVMYRVHLA
jgi:hypothetical protein